MAKIRVQHIPNHVQRLLALLPFWFQIKPVTRGLIMSIGAALQLLEDDVYDAILSDLFVRARGRRLDEWGHLFGVQRRGLRDRWYRKLIRGAALARRCDGSEDALIRTWQAFTAPAKVEFRRMPVKGISVVCFRSSYMPPEYAKRAAAIFRGVAPTGSVVLIEAKTGYLGFLREDDPRPRPLGVGTPARTH